MIASLTPFKSGTLADPHIKFWGAFRQMRHLADVMIVACDSCHVFDWSQYTGEDVKIDEVVDVMNYSSEWQDYAMRLTLLARSCAHKAAWVLWLDCDETLTGVSHSIIRQQIQEAESVGAIAISYDKREMWNQTHYRNDGIWKKDKVVLQKNPFYADCFNFRAGHMERLHYMPLQQGDVLHKPECRLYHWGMSTPELREARVKKYKQEDPGGNNRGYGYDYLQDETGMELVAK